MSTVKSEDDLTRVRQVLFDLLQRHFVALRVELSNTTTRVTEVHSAFLMSIQDEWLLVTAGHCIDDLRKYTIELDYEIIRSDLVDGLGSSSPYKVPIPYNYLDGDPVSLDNEGFDCGILRLNENQRRLLEANGKVPLTEEVWCKQPESCDVLVLVGIPSELTRDGPGSTRIVPSVHHVTEVEREEPFEESRFPMLYGKVELGDGLHSIKGMSGGPIFGFRAIGPDVRYWLIALQSAWNRSDCRIAAPRTHQLGLMINHAIEMSGGAASMRNSRQRT